jgi:hypothetical protein
MLNENLHHLQSCVRDAASDNQAEALLRCIIKGAADAAPVDDLSRIGQTLIDIYREAARNNAERN